MNESEIAKYASLAHKIVNELNNHMREFGFTEKIVLKNDYMTIEEDKIVLRLPIVIAVTIPISHTE